MYTNPWIMADEYQRWVDNGPGDTFRDRISRACHVPHLFTYEESMVIWELKNAHRPAIYSLGGALHYSDRAAWTQLAKGVKLISESHQIDVRFNKRWFTY